MGWIEEIAPDAAQGDLRILYDELERKRGKVSNILQAHSLRPDAMRGHLDLYMDLMFAPGGLSRGQRGMVAVASRARIAATTAWPTMSRPWRVMSATARCWRRSPASPLNRTMRRPMAHCSSRPSS
jgi:hypothetical protein